MSHRDLLDTKPQRGSAPALVTSKHRALTPQVLPFSTQTACSFGDSVVCESFCDRPKKALSGDILDHSKHVFSPPLQSVSRPDGRDSALQSILWILLRVCQSQRDRAGGNTGGTPPETQGTWNVGDCSYGRRTHTASGPP